MKTRILQSVDKPAKFVNLGDGSYYYNFNIEKSTRETSSMDSKEIVEEEIYNYTQVRVYGNPEYNTLVKEVIRAYISAEEEFDLINSYNRVSLTGDEDTKAVQEYTEYIELLKNIKQMVKSDLNG